MEKENPSDIITGPDNTGTAVSVQNEDEVYPLLTEKNDTVEPRTGKRGTGFRIYTPVIIAAAVLFVTVIIFTAWKLFFERDVKGTWTFDFTAGDEKCSLSLELADDGVCYFHEGAIIYKGSYKFSQAQDGQALLKTDFTEYGQPAITANFYYAVEGNNASGKTLFLTDMTGLIFSPYTVEDGAGNDPAALGYDYLEKDGVRYFRLPFRADGHYETAREPFDDAKKDERLTGIWLNKNDDTRHDNTFAFFEDNSFLITYRDMIYKGCYSAENGKCRFRLVTYTGQTQENEFEYKFDGDKLVISIQDVPAEYTRTQSVTAFDNGIK